MRLLIHRADGFTMGGRQVSRWGSVKERAYVLDHAIGHMMAAKTYDRIFLVARQYVQDSFEVGNGPRTQLSMLTTVPAKLAWASALPRGYAGITIRRLSQHPRWGGPVKWVKRTVFRRGR